MEQGLYMGTGREMGRLNPACPEPSPPWRQATAKSFMKYSLHCLSPLDLGLMELLALAMQPPASLSPSVGCSLITLETPRA